MNTEQINARSREKVLEVTNLCKKLNLIASGEQMINDKGMIKQVVYYTDTENYDLDPAPKTADPAQVVPVAPKAVEPAPLEPAPLAPEAPVEPEAVKPEAPVEPAPVAEPAPEPTLEP